MLKNIFLISCTLLSSSISFDSYAFPEDGPGGAGGQVYYEQQRKSWQEIQEREDKRDNDFARAETSCNVNTYATALQNYSNFALGKTSVPGLYKIMERCYESGNLNKLVQTNIDAGGDPTKLCHRQVIVIGEQYIARDGSGRIDWQRYNGASLGSLCMQKMQNLSPEQTADISDTIDTLVKSGCKADKGLLYAAQHGNMTMAQMLMGRGGNLYKPVKVGSTPEHATAISLAQGIMSKIKLMTLQAKVSFRKRHANLEA